MEVISESLRKTGCLTHLDPCHIMSANLGVHIFGLNLLVWCTKKQEPRTLCSRSESWTSWSAKDTVVNAVIVKPVV